MSRFYAFLTMWFLVVIIDYEFFKLVGAHYQGEERVCF